MIISDNEGLLTKLTNPMKTHIKPITTISSTHFNLTPLPAHLLSILVGAFVIMEDSFGITSRQFGVQTCLQSAFQCLIHCLFLEIIMLFSSCSKDSLYPSSRCRARMELFPHSRRARSGYFEVLLCQYSKMPVWLKLSSGV